MYVILLVPVIGKASIQSRLNNIYIIFLFTAFNKTNTIVEGLNFLCILSECSVCSCCPMAGSCGACDLGPAAFQLPLVVNQWMMHDAPVIS